MIDLNDDLINSYAANESAVKNGIGLVKKKSFVKLSKDEADTLLFGECSGSGSSNYLCSADFIKPESPIFRCSCPSRQIPCKHTVGLMYAYVKGESFAVGQVPEDIKEKREKAESREEKKKSSAAPKEKKVNKAALAKKIKMQIEALELFQKLIGDIIRKGFAAIDSKTLDMLEEQGKNLNSSYLPGCQVCLREFINLFRYTENKEEMYKEALEKASAIYTLCKKGKEHLSKRLQDPELALDATSMIDELLGHAWQMSELEAFGLIEEKVELLQLYFNCFEDDARREFVDTAYWIDLNNGKVHKTCNYRPYKAAKHMKEEDSFFRVALVNKLYTYPGEINKRVRWDEMTTRDICNEDFKKISSYAKSNYSEVIKEVKNVMKNPLSDKNPVMLVHYSRSGVIGDEYVIEDDFGKRIKLNSNGTNGDGSALIEFCYDLETNRLTANPLTIIKDNEIIRLVY